MEAPISNPSTSDRSIIVAYLSAQFLCMLDVEQTAGAREEALDNLVGFIRAILAKQPKETPHDKEKDN